MSISKTVIDHKKSKKSRTPKPKISIEIGPPKLTRFERARIIGARSLQLSLGAPPFILVPPNIKDPITLAIAELEAKVLPLSIRRALSEDNYQDIPVDWLL